MRGMARFNHRFHSQQVLIHLALRVRAEDLRERVTYGARRRVIGHPDGDPRAGAVIRIKADDAGVSDGRARFAFPRDYLVGNELGHHRVPLYREAGRAGHRPLRTPVPQVAHLAYVGHEVREVVGVLPEFEDAFDGSVDIDRLVKIYRAPSAAYSEDAPRFEIRGATHHQSES